MGREPSRELPFPVVRRLGGGGFAEVFLVETRSGLAALKVARAVPHDGAGTVDGEQHARGIAFATGSTLAWTPDPSRVLDAEADVLERIRHRAFVRVLDRGVVEVDGVKRSFALLEHVDGVTWQKARIDARHLAEVCRALAAVAASGELESHGDVKPANLMIDASGAVRILDPASGSTERDASGAVARRLVTEHYDPALSGSDVPAIGLTAIEVLTGKHPLVRADPSRPRRPLGPRLAAIVARFGTSMRPLAQRLLAMPLPAELDPALPPALEATCLSCLGLGRDGEALELADVPSMEELARRFAACAPARLLGRAPSR